MENNIENDVINEIIRIISLQNEVIAVAIGGSRATGKADNKSDYDIYVYLDDKIPNDIRQKILSPYCSYMEIGNTYWETEDNCILLNGIFIDIIYRNITNFTKIIADVVENNVCFNGYTTCLWHNLMTCKIAYDHESNLKKIIDRFSVPYPEKLKKNIIKRNMNLLANSIVSYDRQIAKSINRQDMVNVNNRISVFMDSYFDVIFALNEVKNTGEKRFMEICLEQCKILPNEFEENIKLLFYCMGNDVQKINDIIKKMVYELKNITNNHIV